MAAGDVEVNVTSLNAKACAVFDGVDDYVEIPHHISQLGANLSNGFTISAWINARSYGEGPYANIIDKSTASLGNNGFRYFNEATGRIGFQLNIGTVKYSASSAVLPNTGWNHILITISSGQLANFYVNGVLSGTANQNLVQAISTITTTNVLRIGNRSTTTDRTFDGSIKSVKMWNRVLSADEITLDANSRPVPTALNNLILDVPLIKDYTDKGPYSLNGTNSGSYLVVVDDAVATAVKADRTTANDKYMIACAEDGQVITTVIEEAP